ncbi:PP2C family protein-serine/threonine phosphatase [Actinacidiphila paucisporea]|uniref:Serine phosphatase RsbU, regulator of sigma subunit n=1 Tax=Actinacidiphila paucisporea TaxID=310782 RepID=A0A1M7NJR5_9ACTN|nr:PP2C family protein-serine/threonine phosphatase [Actinacidiphila paucisporea]SHN03951.1 Serine phosphatase RsbU, regulator of sigma subunit [Actinacidiphila paucisporea]
MTTTEQLRRRRPAPGRTGRAGVAPILLTAVIGVAAIATPRDVAISRLLPAAPALAASMWSVGATVGLGVLALVVVVAVELIYHGSAAYFTGAAIAAVTAAAGYASHIRLQRERALLQVRSVADAAQSVVLRPVPRRIGGMAIETLYVAAAAQARIGGDLYEAVDTPYGVRLLIGDVRGKGLSAVGVAGAVVNCFREAAYDEPDLAALARRLDTSLVRYGDSFPTEESAERFATALLAQIPHGGGEAGVVNCGHPAPILMRGAHVRALEPTAASPPLNMAGLLGGGYTVDTVPLAPGDQLLLYTDGVTETRNRTGAFFPLQTWLRRQEAVPPRRLLDLLHDQLLRYSGGGLDDDIAALVIRVEAPDADPDRPYGCSAS